MAEDGGDWIFGHHNDRKEWLTNYAAAIYIEESAGLTVRNSRVWHGQNALCLDRVKGSKIYDNDFSFNSGWGIALWRCSSNVISRNAVAFHFRGPGAVTLGSNMLVGVGRELIDAPTYAVTRNDQLVSEPLKVPPYEVFGSKRPVGARPGLRGRQNIIMTEWGPWDHVTPLVHLVRSTGASAVY